MYKVLTGARIEFQIDKIVMLKVVNMVQQPDGNNVDISKWLIPVNYRADPMDDFHGVETENPNCVVLGDAVEVFS